MYSNVKYTIVDHEKNRKNTLKSIYVFYMTINKISIYVFCMTII